MQTYIHKWGNSIGLRIPIKMARTLNLHVGSAVEIDLKDDCIEISPKKYDLADMVKKINRKNLHKETLFSDCTGKEIW